MSGEKHVIAFSSVDSFIGESLVRLTASKHRDEFKTIRGLLRDESHNEELKKIGVEPHLINYEKAETLEKALEHVDTLVFVIENDEKRVQEAEQLVNAVKKAGVKRVLLISCAATENAEGKRLREYQEIEQKVSNIEKHSILRITWAYQAFFLWTRMIQDEGKFRLTVKKENKFTPIDILDVGRAVHKILTNPPSDNKRWTITGPETITAEDVVKKLNSTLQVDVAYEEITQDNLKKYLESLKKQDDYEDFVPRSSQITKVLIEILLEALEHMKQGKSTEKTEDLKKLIGQEGEKLEAFFQGNQKHFKPSKWANANNYG